eukprot:4760021-Heterocapsa_arctica.AAC.1
MAGRTTAEVQPRATLPAGEAISPVWDLAADPSTCWASRRLGPLAPYVLGLPPSGSAAGSQTLACAACWWGMRVSSSLTRALARRGGATRR